MRGRGANFFDNPGHTIPIQQNLDMLGEGNCYFGSWDFTYLLLAIEEHQLLELEATNGMRQAEVTDSASSAALLKAACPDHPPQIPEPLFYFAIPECRECKRIERGSNWMSRESCGFPCARMTLRPLRDPLSQSNLAAFDVFLPLAHCCVFVTHAWVQRFVNATFKMPSKTQRICLITFGSLSKNIVYPMDELVLMARYQYSCKYNALISLCLVIAFGQD